jgi:acyl carrier protein
MTEAELRQSVAQVLGVAASELDDKSSPDQIAGWDSIKTMNIVFALEDATGVEFSDEQISTMLNFRLIRIALEEALGQSLES